LRYWALSVMWPGSYNVIGYVTIRFPIGHILLVVLWNYYGGATPVYGVPPKYGAHSFTHSPTLASTPPH